MGVYILVKCIFRHLDTSLLIRQECYAIAREIEGVFPFKWQRRCRKEIDIHSGSRWDIIPTACNI